MIGTLSPFDIRFTYFARIQQGIDASLRKPLSHFVHAHSKPLRFEAVLGTVLSIIGRACDLHGVTVSMGVFRFGSCYGASEKHEADEEGAVNLSLREILEVDLKLKSAARKQFLYLQVPRSRSSWRFGYSGCR